MEIFQILTEDREAYYCDEEAYIEETQIDSSLTLGRVTMPDNEIRKIKCEELSDGRDGVLCYINKDLCVYIQNRKISKIYYDRNKY